MTTEAQEATRRIRRRAFRSRDARVANKLLELAAEIDQLAPARPPIYFLGILRREDAAERQAANDT